MAIHQFSSPEEIANASFSIGLRGYDRGEVDAFLVAVGDYVRALQQGDQDKPYKSLGEEIGDLLQHAKDAAEGLARKAEEEAEALLDQASTDAWRAKKEAEEDANKLRTAAQREALEAEKQAEGKIKELEEVEREVRHRIHVLRSELVAITDELHTLEEPEGEEEDTAIVEAVDSTPTNSFKTIVDIEEGVEVQEDFDGMEEGVGAVEPQPEESKR